ncbi:MAG TPA: nucleotidyltransferase domain-containing protein [Acidimicrobiales bacterium]|nr:nucleotidyltransferase domain-containing protein [Acidimicrobiales bacterium]
MPEIPPLPKGTILLVEVGSTAHGTGLPGGEDHDEMAVVIEAPADVLSIGDHGYRTVMQRTQPEGSRSGPGDTDRTLHSLRRFVRLAASGNPSILMSLWAPVIYATDEGRQLQGLGEAFVGRHVIPRYRGYMESQMMRLLGLRGGGHGRRGGGGREELISEHGYDTKYAMHAARLGFQGVELLTTRRLQLPIAGEPAEWLRAVRRGEVAFDEWMERCSALDAELERMATDDSKPDGPDRATIEHWCVATHLTYWSAPPPNTTGRS